MRRWWPRRRGGRDRGRNCKGGGGNGGGAGLRESERVGRVSGGKQERCACRLRGRMVLSCDGEGREAKGSKGMRRNGEEWRGKWTFAFSNRWDRLHLCRYGRIRYAKSDRILNIHYRQPFPRISQTSLPTRQKLLDSPSQDTGMHSKLQASSMPTRTTLAPTAVTAKKHDQQRDETLDTIAHDARHSRHMGWPP